MKPMRPPFHANSGFVRIQHLTVHELLSDRLRRRPDAFRKFFRSLQRRSLGHTMPGQVFNNLRGAFKRNVMPFPKYADHVFTPVP